jgi:hypothetical protein
VINEVHEIMGAVPEPDLVRAVVAAAAPSGQADS